MRATNEMVRKSLSFILAILVAIIGSIPFLIFKDEIQDVSLAGYLGLLCACILTNATVFLPASGIAFTVSASTVLNPLICCCIGGLGTALGELMSFFCGRAGKQLVEKRQIFSKIKLYVEKQGFIMVLLFAFLPFPIFDFVGVTAGASQMSIFKYFSACVIGKILKMILYVIVIYKMYGT